MKDEERDELRTMQANPTTGTPHNHQLIYTQVETVFALDELVQEIATLKNTLELSSKQSEKLARSNNILQSAILVLTAISTMIISIPIVATLTRWTLNLDNEFQVQLVAISLSISIAIIIFLVEKKVLKTLNFSDSVTIHDKLDIRVIKKE